MLLLATSCCYSAAAGADGVLADPSWQVILFNLYMVSYPDGWKCLGGTDYNSYDLTPDFHFIRYIVARLGAYSNVWWSMSNEWSQCACKFNESE